jgi:carboxypeptidase PM20D1
VNYRMLPGDDSKAIMARLHVQIAKSLGHDRFSLEALPGASEASPVASSQSEPYLLVNRTVREVFPGTLVAPGLMLGGTDSRHFADISDQIFKFSPVRARSEDLARFHGTNERISLDNLAELIRFYHRLVTMGAKASRTPPTRSPP